MPTQLKNIVADLRSLAPFPTVATSVLALASDDDTGPEDIVKLIQTDPGLTGKVLKLCNSAYYGFQREIASLKEASNMLGVRTLTNLVLTSSAGNYFQDHGKATGNSQDDLWEQCVTNAIAARLIARHHRRTDPERAYTAGLLQNVGHLVLDRFYGDEHQQVQCHINNGTTRLQAEKAVIGIHHAEIGARLSSRWMLPEVLVDTIRYHHEPQNAETDPALAGTIHLAEAIARATLGDSDASTIVYEISEAAYDLTDLCAGDLADLDMDLQSEMQKARDLVGL
jgi:HD-like signal output (HDOD) protein